MGEPILVGGGLMAAVLDRSADLYSGRTTWLDEHGIHGAEREMYRRCWFAMDRTLVGIIRKQVDDGRKEAEAKAKAESGKSRWRR